MGSDAEVYDSAYFMKEAADWKLNKGGIPLAAALAGALLLNHMSHGIRADTQNAQFGLMLNRQAEARLNAGDDASLMGGGQLSYPGAAVYQATMADSNTPNFSDYGSFGYLDKVSEALAESAGRSLAKHAGIIGGAWNAFKAVNHSPGALLGGIKKVVKPVVGLASKAMPNVGLGTKVLGGAAAVGTGLLAAKAGRAALRFGNQPAAERVQGAPGPGLPRYVNEYGVPE